MRRVLVLLVVVVLLAGCADRESTTGGAGHGTASTAADEPGGLDGSTTRDFSFDGTFPLRVVTGAVGTFGVGDNGGNCVIFPTDIAVGAGNATVTWATPVPSDLTVGIRVDGTNKEWSQTGQSPVTVSFDGLPQAAGNQFDWGYFFMVQAGTVPLAVADVELHVAFAYKATAPLEVQATDAACG